jgi:hypothetical protein
MGKRLKDSINSSYFEAANALTSKKARHRIVAYVESYDDIYFWRTVLSEFENDKRYFEVMLPSKMNLTRGKKSVLMNFLEGEPLGKDMIACVDADYDYLVQGLTAQSHGCWRVLTCSTPTSMPSKTTSAMPLRCIMSVCR